MSEQKLQASAVPKLKKSFVLKYSTTGISLAASYALLSYVTMYASDVVGLNLATISLVLMVSKIFDGITDFIAGILIDHTHTRWGKARPYTLAIVGYWICLGMLFSTPKLSQTAAVIYLFVIYTVAISGFNTLVSCSEAPLMANTLDDPRQSVTLLSFGGVMSAVMGLIFGIMVPQLVAGAGNDPAAWGRMAWMMAIPLAVLGSLRFFLIKEKETSAAPAAQQAKRASLKEMLSVLFHNKYMLILALLVLIAYIGAQTIGAAATYYNKYIFGDVGIGSIMSLALLPMIIFVAIMPALVKRFSMKSVFNVVVIVGMAGCLLRLADIHNVAVGFVGCCMASIAFQAFYGFANTLLLDCMDYGEWKTGVRLEGAMASATSFMNKIGTAIGGTLPGVLIGMAGYDGTLAVQNDAANGMIVAATTIVPLVFYVLFFIVFRFYDLEGRMPQIRQELSARRGAQR